MPNDPKLLRIRDVPNKILELTGCTRGVYTIYHWIHKGRLTYDGRLIKLKAVKRLSTYLVHEDDLIEFLREVG